MPHSPVRFAFSCGIPPAGLAPLSLPFCCLSSGRQMTSPAVYMMSCPDASIRSKSASGVLAKNGSPFRICARPPRGHLKRGGRNDNRK